MDYVGPKPQHDVTVVLHCYHSKRSDHQGSAGAEPRFHICAWEIGGGGIVRRVGMYGILCCDGKTWQGTCLSPVRVCCVDLSSNITLTKGSFVIGS